MLSPCHPRDLWLLSILLMFLFRMRLMIEFAVAPLYLHLSQRYMYQNAATSSTYDHRILKAMLPVRSAIFKQDTGGSVVRWVTTGEYPLLYVFLNF
jgi:hypothetical protein